jgi:altronate dehydratase
LKQVGKVLAGRERLGTTQPQQMVRALGRVNAGRVILGESTIAERGREMFESVVDVAAGKLTKAEALGHRECCVPYKYQETCNALS